MIFGASATHALRALAHLAGEGDEPLVLGRDLAMEIGVPAHYLAKVLGTLARAGLLAASRGVHGGYRLARPAREIRLIEVVAPFEGKRLRPGCLLSPDRPCREDAACAAHPSWSEVKAAYSAFLETTTLADIQGGVPAPARRAPRARGGRRSPPGRARLERGRGRTGSARHRVAGTLAGSSWPPRGGA